MITQFKSKQFGPKDIDIKIECCGVCGSDVHKINGGFGKSHLPICVGHEIVGRAVNIGREVTTVKIGDRVGVGAQVWACLKCPPCKSGNENYCPHQVGTYPLSVPLFVADYLHPDTYGAPYPKEADPEQSISQGGYASHIRVHEYFTFKIPDEIPSHIAGPMMCAGLTVWSPLSRTGVGPGKKVAVVGLGGLGHFAVIFANALGAEVTVLSHSPRKKEDAFKLGAKDFVVTTGDGWAKPLAFKFDLVLNTADATHTFDMASYLSICAINAQFHQVGIPDHALPQIKVQSFMPNGCSIGASHIGSRSEMFALLELVAKTKAFPMIETISISEEGCKSAVTSVFNNDVRYRLTLTDYDKVFGA